MGQTNPLDALAPVVNPLDALAPVKKATKKPSTEGKGAEFLRRMLTQVVSPVDPLHKLGKTAGDVIEGVARPSTDSSIGATIKQAAESIKADPLMGTAKTVGSAAMGLTGIPSILEYLTQAAGAVTDLGNGDAFSPAGREAQGLPAEPTAAERLKERFIKGAGMARGYVGGVVEGASSLSPLDALMLKLGANSTPEGLKGGFRLGKGRIPPAGGDADLRAQAGGTILSKEGTVVRGRERPSGPSDSDPGGPGGGGGVVDADTIREALQKLKDQSRPQRTFISPAEPPPRSPTMGRDQTGKPIPEPGSGSTKFDTQTPYTPEERALLQQPLADWAAERPVQAEAETRPARAARSAAIDKAHADTVREIEKRMREAAVDEPLDLPVEGTTRGEAYAAGATPAEAGKAAAEARAEGTKLATEAAAPVNIPKGTDIHAVLQSVEQAAIDRIKARGTFKGGRLSSGLPVDDLMDLATIGATRIARGTVKFAEWSAGMVEAIGDEIKPHLKEIWTKAQDIHDKQLKSLMPKAGRAPLPTLPRKSGTAPAKAKAVSSSGQLKEALSRERILKELGGLKVDDPALAKKVARFKYLSDQNYQEGAAARLTEMGRLEKEILAHSGLPEKLKERWTKLGSALPEVSQADRNAMARTEAAADKPARLDPKAIEAGRALEARIREMGGNKAIKTEAARLVPDEPITQRSAALAESLAADVPELAPRPVAEIPPESSSAAVGDSLARAYSPSSLSALLEQVRAGVGKATGNQPEVMEVLKSLGDEATLTPSAKALVDTIEAHIAEAGSDVSMDRLKQAQAKDRLFTSHRPLPATTIRPKTGRSTVDVPPEARQTFPRRYGSNESVAWRKMAERDKELRAAREAVKPETPTIRSIEDIKNLGGSRAGSPTAATPRPLTYREQQVKNQLGKAEGERTVLASGKPVRSGSIAEREIGPPPPGVEPELWAKVNAMEVEGRLLQEQGITDPRLVDEMRKFWGAEEAAARLGLTKPTQGLKGREAIRARASNKAAVDFVREIGGGPSRVPLTKVLEDTEARFKHLLDDPHGFMRLEALLAGTGAAAGGLVGATIGGENATDHLAYGLSGAIIGGLLGHAGGKGIKYLGDVYSKPKTRTDLQNTIDAVDTANLLAGPAVIKTSFGSLGGISAGLWQRLSEGNTAAARAGYDYITSPRGMVKDFYKTLTGPVNRLGPGGPYTNQVGTQMGFTPPNNFPARLARQVLRPFIAGDRAAGEALRRMGFSKEEAARLQLVGEPTSWQGQAVNNLISSNFALRMLAKFPRVRVGGLERAVEFTPGLHKFNTRSTKAGTPQFFRGGLKPQEQLNAGARRARAQFGGAAILTGTAYGYLMDPSLQHMGVAASVAGPAYLPMAAGMAAGKAIRHGREPLTEALLSVASSIPQIGEADVRPSGLARRLTPLGPAMRAIERMQEGQ